jgi:hypothetical protein
MKLKQALLPLVALFASAIPVYAGPPGDNIADLRYDRFTGNVLIVPDPSMISFVLEVNPGPVTFLNTQSIVFPTNSVLVDRDPLIIGWTDLASSANNPFSLGNILPSGLSLSTLSSLLVTADFSRSLGSGGRFNLEVVPEPATVLVLLGTASGMILGRRRVV